MKNKLNYVEAILDNEIIVFATERGLASRLKHLGGKRRYFIFGPWIIKYSYDLQLADLLSSLRDLGIALAGSSGGWPPSAVFENLRERGHIMGEYTEILWHGPDNPFTSIK